MKHYDRYYILFEKFNIYSILVFFISVAIVLFLSINKIEKGTIIAFFLFGSVADILINIIIGFFWGHESLNEAKVIKKSRDDDGVDLKELRVVSWLPRIVGILERIIFTYCFIINKPEYIGGWLAIKVIGNWKTGNTINAKGSGLWRVKENIFLIGTALSIIFSFFAASYYKDIIKKYESLKKFPMRQYKIYNHPVYRYR